MDTTRESTTSTDEQEEHAGVETPTKEKTANVENNAAPAEETAAQALMTRGQAIFVSVVGVGLVLLAAAVIWRLQGGGWDSPSDHFRKGWEAFVREDDVELENRCRKLLKIPRYKSHAEVLHAALYIREGRFRHALTMCQQYAQHEDVRGHAMTIAGMGMLEVGTQMEALNLFVRAVQIDRDNLLAHRNAGSLFYDLGAMDLAIRHLSEVSRLAPSDPRPHRLMGLINKDYGRYDAAVVDYEESLKRNAHHDRRDVLLEMAQSKLKLKRFKEAMENLNTLQQNFRVKGELKAAKSLSAKDRLTLVDSMVARSEALQSLNQHKEAFAEIDLALKYAPNHLEALLHKANMLLSGNKPQEALPLGLRSVQRHPKSEVAFYTLAQIYSQLQQDVEAQKALKEFQKLKDMRTKFVEANIQAIKEPNNVDIRFELALLAAELDRPQLAITWLKAVLTLKDTHTEARQKLDELQKKLETEFPERSQKIPVVPAQEVKRKQ